MSASTRRPAMPAALLAPPLALLLLQLARQAVPPSQDVGLTFATGSVRGPIQAQTVRSSAANLVAGGFTSRPAPGQDEAQRAGQPLLPIFAAAACAAAVLLRSRVVAHAAGKPSAMPGIRVRKPLNNALRNSSVATYEECTTRVRFEPLVMKWAESLHRGADKPRGHPLSNIRPNAKRCSGHRFQKLSNFQGYKYKPWYSDGKQPRAKRMRIVDWMRDKRGMFATIETVEYDPFRGARICLVKYEDGERRYILHATGYFVGQQIIADEEAPVFVGNAMPLSEVPTGTQVHNVQVRPDSCSTVGRCAGSCLTVIGQDAQFATVKMPSGEVRLYPKDSWCTIGKVGRPEHNMIKWGKAGKSRQKGFMPKVRGKVKNACDHPHGGGEGHAAIGHKHPKDPMGRCTHGRKTYNPKGWGQQFILIRRKRKDGM